MLVPVEKVPHSSVCAAALSASGSKKRTTLTMRALQHEETGVHSRTPNASAAANVCTQRATSSVRGKPSLQAIERSKERYLGGSWRVGKHEAGGATQCVKQKEFVAVQRQAELFVFEINVVHSGEESDG
jgi:hypothetical protein